MENYVRNRGCRCVRCMACDLMGAAVLITLGVLFLLSSWSPREIHNGVPALGLSFHYTWPVLLIVIGAVLFLRSSGSTAGHIQPGAPAAGAPAPPSSSETKDPSHG